jgi:hypothetical protein
MRDNYHGNYVPLVNLHSTFFTNIDAALLLLFFCAAHHDVKKVLSDTPQRLFFLSFFSILGS